jgi:dTDP-4-dehydrorhamnose 3,5-epimerase
VNWSVSRRGVIHPLDPALGIPWPMVGPADAPILSDKDGAGPAFEEALLSGALPRADLAPVRS